MHYLNDKIIQNYVSLTTIGYFQCYIYSHWLSQVFNKFLYEYGPWLYTGGTVTCTSRSFLTIQSHYSV